MVDQLGFKPTVGNVFKLICDGVDSFFNVLKAAGDTTRTSPSTQVLTSGAWPTVVMNRSYMTPGNGGITALKQPTYVYPPMANPAYSQWKEVQFVETYINTMLRQKQQETLLDNQVQNAQNEPKQWIPISPLDTQYTNGNIQPPYSSLNDSFNTNSFLLILLQRYQLAFQYSYKSFIWNDWFGSDRRASLVQFVAQAEAYNLINSINDSNTLALLKNLCATFTNNGRNSNIDLLTYTNGLEDKSSELSNFFYQNNNNTSSLVYNGSTYYPYKKSYQGLSLFTDPITIFTIDNISSDTQKKLLQTYQDYINSFTNYSTEQLTKITQDNIPVFQDLKAQNGGIYQSDFFLFKNDIITKFGNIDIAKLTVSNFFSDQFFDLYNVDSSTMSLGYNWINNLLYRNNNKFLYPAIIQSNYLWVFFVGQCITIGSLNGEPLDYSNLSTADQLFFTTCYDTYLPDFTTMVSDILAQSIVLSNDNFSNYLKNNTTLTQLLQPINILNNSSFTFVPTDDLFGGIQIGSSFSGTDYEQFIPLGTSIKWNGNVGGQKVSSVFVEQFIDYQDGFKSNPVTTSSRIFQFTKTFFSTLYQAIQTKTQDLNKINQELQSIINDNDLKTDLYYSFKELYDRWISQNISNGGSSYAYPFNNGTSLFSKFQFVSRTFEDISQISCVDITPIIEAAQDSGTQLYSVIGSLLSKNNYEFFPQQTIVNFVQSDNGTDKSFLSMFDIYEVVDANVSPGFVCMYVGGYSSFQNTNNPAFPDDGVYLTSSIKPDGTIVLANNTDAVTSDITSNNAVSQVNAFAVNVGLQNQQIFSKIEFKNNEVKETGQSLAQIDRVFNSLGNTSAQVPKAQNLMTVYRQRYYTTTVVVPLGNTMIQPMQYYELLHMPIIGGVYIILEVTHRMNGESNKVETTFTGTRIGRYIMPIVKDPLINGQMLPPDLQQAVFTNNPPTPYTPGVPLVRTDNNILLVQPGPGGSFIYRTDGNPQPTNNPFSLSNITL